MTVYLQDTDLTLHHGDCLEVLRTLPDRSVHMCATSPPFYGLRDYGTGEWEGGDPDCDHKAGRKNHDHAGNVGPRNEDGNAFRNSSRYVNQGDPTPNVCRCGARRVDQQIGLEETPDQWVERLVAVFREVRRVLRDDGVLFVEIGDSYAHPAMGGTAGSSPDGPRGGRLTDNGRSPSTMGPGLKQKDLLGQPWLLAFALRADGWYLRSEIIWARPNPMPESVTDRPTKSHSTVFLLSKRPRYFWDADAIREAFAGRDRSGEPVNGSVGVLGVKQSGRRATLDGSDGESPRGPDGRRVTAVKGQENSEQHRDGERWPNPTGANARSVWTIPTEPTPFAHFATWPRKLVARMILAGTSERGCCPVCGAPWVRDTTVDYETSRQPGEWNNGGYDAKRTAYATHGVATKRVSTVGWSPSCAHDTTPVPCTVLDPFAGSGTTLLVARQHGRHSIGIELNPAYCDLVRDRTSQQSLLADAP